MTRTRLPPIDDLARILGEATSPPSAPASGYIPVAVDALRPGAPLGFRIYLQTGGRFIPFHGRTATFTPSDRQRLLDFKQPTVFVAREETTAYQAYAEAHIEEIVRDGRIPEQVKAGIVYRSAQGIMRDILLHSDGPDTVERSQRAAGSTVEYVLRGRESFLSLLSSCAFDYQTYTHSVNVCIFSVGLARHLGFGPEALEEIGSGVLLHDIGKVRVDPAILHKTGPLSQDEWDIMHKHPSWGVEMVRGQKGMTPRILDLILHHHEKLDGSGYPEGLSRDTIPMEVRITTLCDIFDALTTNRTYKNALSTFDTLATIHKSMRGKIDQDLLRELVLILKSE
jgi:putative nucleotidyltransferase with HDIG domain